MTEMHHYVCWTDEAVRASTPRDAASLEPGHFQAGAPSPEASATAVGHAKRRKVGGRDRDCPSA